MKLFDEIAVFHRPDGVVRVSGPDRLGYLHVMLSQHVEHLEPGSAADFLYLDHKGNALAAGRAVAHPEHVVLITPVAVAAELAQALEKFKFLMQVEAADCSGELAVASVRGGGDTIELDGAPAEPMRAAVVDGGLLVRDRDGGVDVIGPPDWVRDRVSALPEATEPEWESWRISAGVPGWGTEVREGRRAQELGLLPTHVHLQKGCYPGQESIAKIYNLGRPRRTLAVIEASGPLAAGDAVDAGGKRGEVTSAARIGDRWRALALLPLDRDGSLAGGGGLAVGDVRATVLRRVAEGLPQPGA
jgi:folate-binding protein YgfZ